MWPEGGGGGGGEAGTFWFEVGQLSDEGEALLLHHSYSGHTLRPFTHPISAVLHLQHSHVRACPRDEMGGEDDNKDGGEDDNEDGGASPRTIFR